MEPEHWRPWWAVELKLFQQVFGMFFFGLFFFSGTREYHNQSFQQKFDFSNSEKPWAPWKEHWNRSLYLLCHVLTVWLVKLRGFLSWSPFICKITAFPAPQAYGLPHIVQVRLYAWSTGEVLKFPLINKVLVSFTINCP